MVFDKDYKMLTALEKGAKSRTELCDGTNAAYSRLTRLIERGLIVPENWEPAPGQEAKFRLSGEGRAYIQDLKRERLIKKLDRIFFSIILPIGLTLLTNFLCKLFSI